MAYSNFWVFFKITIQLWWEYKNSWCNQISEKFTFSNFESEVDRKQFILNWVQELVWDSEIYLCLVRSKNFKFCLSGLARFFWNFGRKVLICSATVKISNIPSRSNFSSDPDLDFDNIEIKWDLYGTRTRRLAVRHFATHAFCFRSTLPEKIFDQLQAILIGSRISIYDWAQLNKVTLYSSIPWGIRSQFAELA